MRATLRIVIFLFCLFAVGQHSLKAQASSCIYADAGTDDTVCLTHCTTISANVTGTRSSSAYSNIPIPYAPYSFTGGNPVLVQLDDVWSPAVSIPFCFEYYGTVYNQLVIGTNGLITFDASQANGPCPWTINLSAPSPFLPLNCIMAPYHDMDPTIVTALGATSINWNVYGTAPCRSFVINWNDVGMYGAGCDSLVSTSQVVLHESTNIIDIFIKDKGTCLSWNSGSAIEGLQNAGGTAATIYSGRNYPSAWSVSNDGIEFRPAGAADFTVQWLDFSNNVIGNTGSQQVCPTTTTSYIMNVINTGCDGIPVTLTDTVTVVVIQSNINASDTVVYPTCQNNCSGSITVIPIGGVPPFTYTWVPNLGNGPTLSNLCPGLYGCMVTDATGCTSSITENLVVPPPFNMATASTASNCNDSTGSVSVNVFGSTGPFTIYWSTGDSTYNVSNLPPGNYQVLVIDSAGCRDSVMVNVPSAGLQLTTQSTQLLCNGDCNATATVTTSSGTGPLTYTWLPYGGSAATASSLCSGMFICHVMDSTGCSSSAMVTIASPPAIIATPSANQTICFGQSTVLSVVVTGGTAPYTYHWSNGLPATSSNTITPAQTTIYTIYITDANGCTSAQQSTLVKVVHAPVAGFTSTTADCPPSVIHFTNTTDTAVVYHWEFGDPFSGMNDTSSLINPDHTYSTGGNYSVTLIATNAYGCADALILPNAVFVPDGANAAASLNTAFLTIMDPVVLLNNLSTDATSYIIYFGDGDSLVTTSTGPYAYAYDTLGTFTITLIALNQNGCNDTTWLTVVVEEPTTLFIPNAFTPNGDGKNDVFMVSGNNIVEMHLMVFNRWGELIFESNDMYDGWNGTFKDARVPEDVYVWKLTYTDNSGDEHKNIGHVSLIR